MKSELDRCFPVLQHADDVPRYYLSYRATDVQFQTVSASYRDILQTGREAYAYNYPAENKTELPSSIVSPALLVEEMELSKSEGKATKLPAVSSPLSGK